MYRKPSEYITSVRSVNDSLPSWTHLLIANMKSRMEKMIMDQFAMESDRTNPLLIRKAYVNHYLADGSPEVNRFAVLYCGNILSMKDLTKIDGIDFGIVSYHDLTVDPKAEMEKILAHCQIKNNGLLNHHLPKGDSQQNSGLSKKTLKSFKISLNEEEINSVNKVLSDCNLPNCHDFPINGKKFKELIILS